MVGSARYRRAVMEVGEVVMRLRDGSVDGLVMTVIKIMLTLHRCGRDQQEAPHTYLER